MILENKILYLTGINGTIDVGEIVAFPWTNSQSYGAAYFAKVSVTTSNHSNSSKDPNALDDFKKEVRSWLTTNAKVINMSYTPLLLIELAKNTEGKKLLTELLIEGDRILVISAGNHGIFHGMGDQKKIWDLKRNQVNLGDLYVDEAFQEFMGHVVYVGNLTYAADTELEKDKKKLENIQWSIANISFSDYFSRCYPTLRTLDLGVLTLALKEMELNMSSFARFIKKTGSYLSNEEFSELFKKKQALLSPKSWVLRYIEDLFKRDHSYSEVKKALEDPKPLDPPPLYPSNKYRLHETSNRAGLNADHFICTLGTDIESTAGGFNEAPCYKTATGTSQAAPLVTSALLLGLQKYPGIKAVDLLKKLYDSADHLKGLEYWYGHGVMNVKNFLTLQ